MRRTMRRSKQQVLLRFLPGRTFDFERIATIARVQGIRGVPSTDLNLDIVVSKVSEETRGWDPVYRRTLPSNVLNDPSQFVFNDPSQFVLLDPHEVRAELFPKVLWCQSRACGRVYNYESRENLPRRCQYCQSSLAQLRFVKVHRCGEIRPLQPPSCSRCKNAFQMALDTRGSERLSNFRWICRNRGCNYSVGVFGGQCPSCPASQWPADQQMMDVEVHRAGRTYYPHSTVLLNIPNRAYETFLNVPEWQYIAAAKFLGMIDRPLSDFRPPVASGADAPSVGGLSGDEVERLLRRFDLGEISATELTQEMQRLNQQRRQEQQSTSASGVARQVVESSGIPGAIWENAGQELLEASMPLEISSTEDLDDKVGDPVYQPAIIAARRMGLRVRQLADFPMLTATYGYSRIADRPGQCRLNPFPPEREHAGKHPIYVDQVQADALLVSLDHNRVWRWLERNSLSPVLPLGTEQDVARRAYFIQLLTSVSVRETITSDQSEARMVFGLLHTLSHLCLRQASLLCGLDSTSLSEYILPRTLTLAIYSNHRSGATIGALTALFEQTLAEWLNSIRRASRCVYDPVCYQREGNCHACTHLAETSCRFFNLNLSRAFLFGGYDKYLGQIEVGYFDPSL